MKFLCSHFGRSKAAREYKEWLGYNFDPTEFDLDETRGLLAEIVDDGLPRLCYFPGKRRGYILQSRPLSQEWERAWGLG